MKWGKEVGEMGGGKKKRDRQFGILRTGPRPPSTPLCTVLPCRSGTAPRYAGSGALVIGQMKTCIRDVCEVGGGGGGREDEMGLGGER